MIFPVGSINIPVGVRESINRFLTGLEWAIRVSGFQTPSLRPFGVARPRQHAAKQFRVVSCRIECALNERTRRTNVLDSSASVNWCAADAPLQRCRYLVFRYSFWLIHLQQVFKCVFARKSCGMEAWTLSVPLAFYLFSFAVNTALQLVPSTLSISTVGLALLLGIQGGSINVVT